MRTFTRLAAATLLTAALAGCGSSGESTGTPQAANPVPATAAKPAAAPATAASIVKKLSAAKLGLTAVTVQDEDTDPNRLLGRPNGYLTRASADLPGGNKQADKGSVDRGLVVETFETAEGATTRSDYIQELQKGSPILGTEWHYPAADGLALVRVSGNVKPSLAKKIEQAVAGL